MIGTPAGRTVRYNLRVDVRLTLPAFCFGCPADESTYVYPIEEARTKGRQKSVGGDRVAAVQHHPKTSFVPKLAGWMVFPLTT